MAEEFTAKFKVDISDLKKNISEANRQMKLAKAEFDAASAGMDDWSKSADGVSKKLESLDKILSAQKAILNSYREQLVKQQQAYEENGKRAAELRAKLQELADKGVSKTSAEYKQYEKALQDCEKEQVANGKAVEKLELQVLQQEAAVGKTEKEIRQYNTQLDALESASEGAADETEQLAEATEDAGENLDEINKEAAEATKSLQELAQKGAEKVQKALAAVGAAVIGAVTGLTALVINAANAADELGDLSNVTGLSTEKLQQYQYTADMVGTSLETITGSQTKLVKSMTSAAKGTGETAEAFKKLGVNVKNTDGTMRDTDEVFLEMIDALGGIENETERDAVAMQIFGKSAKDLNPLIRAGSKALSDYSKEAEELGIIVSDDVTSALGDVAAEIKRVKAQFNAAKQNFAANFAPVVQKGLQAIQKIIQRISALGSDPKLKNAIAKLGEAITKLITNGLVKLEKMLPKLLNTVTWVVDNFKTLAIVLTGLWAVFKGASVITGVITTLKTLQTSLVAIKAASAATTTGAAAMNAAFAGLLANPIVLALAAITAAVVAAGAAIKEHNKAIRTMIENATESTVALHNEVTSIVSSAEASRDAYRSTVETTAMAAAEVNKYLDRLEELEQQTSMTEDEQDEYRKTIAKINAIMPELNLQIDKETGYLKGGIKPLREQIELITKRAKLSATESALTKEYENQYELQRKLNRANEEYNTKLDKYLRVKELHARMTELANKNDEESVRLFREAKAELDSMNSALGISTGKWSEQEEIYRTAAETARVAMSETYDAFEQSVQISDELVHEYELLGGEAAVVSEETDELTVEMDELGESMESTGEKAARLANEHFAKVSGAVTDMFNEINESTDLSMTKIIETLKHNSEALSRYQENLRTIYERGASENVMTYLESLGTEQAGVIAMVAQSTDEEFQDFISQFDDNTAQAKAAGEEWGQWLAIGVRQGMDSQLADLKRAAQRAARELSNAFQNTLQISSPSKLFKRFGIYTGEGFILGFKNITPKMSEVSKLGAKKVADSFRNTLKLIPGNGFSTQVGAAWAQASRNSMQRYQGGTVISGKPGLIGGGTTEYNYTQIINAPKQPSRIELYRQTKNLLSYAAR